MDEQNRLPLERRLLIVSETVRLAEQAFVHWEDAMIRPVDLEQTAETFFEKAACAETRADFQKVMWELFGRLRNAHSSYFDHLAPAPVGGHLSFFIMDLGGEWVVRRDVLELLQTGDSVISIEGRHPSEWCKELEPYTGIANRTSQNIRVNRFFSYFIPQEMIQVEIEDRNNSRRTIVLPRLAGHDERLRASTKSPETEGRWLQDGKAGYIRIPNFGEPKYEARALELVHEYRHAPAIIIDVRGNGGGSTPSRLTKRLMDRPYRWWMERARHPERLWKRHGGGDIRFADDYSYAEWQPNWREPAEESERYKGRLIFLTDALVGSAAEDFVMPFKDNGRATIVGGRTWGSTGQPVFRRFANDIEIRIGSIRAYMPNGDPFEGIGIAPDVEVSIHREDIYTKRDRALEQALELI